MSMFTVKNQRAYCNRFLYGMIYGKKMIRMGNNMVTINDIAKLAGVAKSTVSRYLNGGSVSRKTKETLDRIIQETEYVPNTFAQSLKVKQSNLIGIIIPRLNSYAINEILVLVRTQQACLVALPDSC